MWHLMTTLVPLCTGCLRGTWICALPTASVRVANDRIAKNTRLKRIWKSSKPLELAFACGVWCLCACVWLVCVCAGVTFARLYWEWTFCDTPSRHLNAVVWKTKRYAGTVSHRHFLVKKSSKSPTLCVGRICTARGKRVFTFHSFCTPHCHNKKQKMSTKPELQICRFLLVWRFCLWR